MSENSRLLLFLGAQSCVLDYLPLIDFGLDSFLLPYLGKSFLALSGPASTYMAQPSQLVTFLCFFVVQFELVLSNFELIVLVSKFLTIIV